MLLTRIAMSLTDLNMLLLIISYRNDICIIEQNICCHKDRISEIILSVQIPYPCSYP